MTWDFQADEFYAAHGYSTLARLPSLGENMPGKVLMDKSVAYAQALSARADVQKGHL